MHRAKELKASVKHKETLLAAATLPASSDWTKTKCHEFAYDSRSVYMYDSGYMQQSSRIAICETSQGTVLHARTTDGANLRPSMAEYPAKRSYSGLVLSQTF